jgi:hypothetical protein
MHSRVTGPPIDQNDNYDDAVLSSSSGGGLPQKQDERPPVADAVTLSQSEFKLSVERWHNYSTTRCDDVSRKRRRRYSDDSVAANRSSSRDHLSRRYSDFIVGRISARWPSASVDTVSGLADRSRRHGFSSGGDGGGTAGSFSTIEANRFRANATMRTCVNSDGQSSEDDVDVTGEWIKGAHSDKFYYQKTTTKTATRSDGIRRDAADIGRRMAIDNDVRQVNKRCYFMHTGVCFVPKLTE